MTEVLEATEPLTPEAAAEQWQMPRYRWPFVLVKSDFTKSQRWALAIVHEHSWDSNNKCLEVSRIGQDWANLFPMVVYHVDDPRLQDPQRRRCMVQMDDETGIFKLHPQFELLDKTVMGLNADMQKVFADLYQDNKKDQGSESKK